MIDQDGFRPNVGIILANKDGMLFWGRRVGQNAWQFPQGGIEPDESPESAMYRELREETGLTHEQVQVLGRTRGWLRYRLPKRYIRKHCSPVCVGQKQVWFLLRLICPDNQVCFDHSEKPEFDDWRWVNFWHPVDDVVFFKRRVYYKALRELGGLLFPQGVPDREKSGKKPSPARFHLCR